MIQTQDYCFKEGFCSYAKVPTSHVLTHTVNSEIFARVLFSRNGQITQSFADVDKSCPSRDCLMWQICHLTQKIS